MNITAAPTIRTIAAGNDGEFERPPDHNQWSITKSRSLDDDRDRRRNGSQVFYKPFPLSIVYYHV